MTNHDVLIIGSGASGGMVAHTLTRKGIRCLMLDAGPPVDFNRDRALKPVYELPYRGFGQPGRFPHVTQASEFNASLWADEKQNPYTYPDNDPYYWVRARLIGGKTMMWGRASWRLSDHVLASKDIDGFGENWPVRYQDLAPFYDLAEPLFRVSGRRDGIPQIPDGNFLEDSSTDSESVARFVASCKQRGVPTTKARRATGQLASSANLLLPDALATGNLTIVPNAVVRELTVDKNTGLVNGATFVDRHSLRELHAKARIVVVGASTLESTRLLLNSGIANSSGVLGHYLHDQFYVKNIVQAVVPEARDGKARRGLMGGGGYIPRFRNLDKPEKDKRFIRGYSVDFGSGGTPSPKYYSAWGDDLRKQLARDAGAGFNMTAMGEVLARKENHVRINKDVKDAWGIPVLHIEHKYTDNEFEMAKDAMNTLDEICRSAGFEVVAKHPHMVPPGESIHEIGTCRMGNDPKTSVLNKWNQSHDVRNLFVVDGSSFVSGGIPKPDPNDPRFIHAGCWLYGRADGQREFMILLLYLFFQSVTAPPPGPPPPPPAQPIPFSHKQHIALKLKCKMCHTNADPGESMGIAEASVCMQCHSSIKADSPAIQKLASFATQNRNIPWKRVYQIPSFVDFSHKTHLSSGATCETCHGQVEQRDALFRETNISMGACMDCHRQHKAPIDCTACHEQRN